MKARNVVKERGSRNRGKVEGRMLQLRQSTERGVETGNVQIGGGLVLPVSHHKQLGAVLGEGALLAG